MHTVQAARAGASALVPILVRVQQLQKRLRESAESFASAWNYVDAFLRLEHADAPDVYRMLRQALLARHALILIDGVNEASSQDGTRDAIEHHLVDVLALQVMSAECRRVPPSAAECRRVPPSTPLIATGSHKFPSTAH